MKSRIQNILLIGLLSLPVIPLRSQPGYIFDSIPEKLRLNAGAVIRTAQYRFTLKNEKKSKLEVKVAITLLNDKADVLHVIGLPYDNFRKVSGISARAFDEKGKLIWNLRKFNIADRSDFSGPEKLSDTRKKVFEVPSFNYPFTIEYRYTMNMEDLFLSPSLFLQPDPGISVQEAGVVYIIPKGTEFRYRALHIQSPADSVIRKGNMVLSWKETNLPASGGSDRFEAHELPVIWATPVHFEMKGYRGSLHNWKEYGNWIAQLNSGLDILDSTSLARARSLVESCVDRHDSIRALYEYLQMNSHYFYTGHGIGGTRPIPAAEVARYGYGDCKALSNYMKALLEAIGIESWYTLVRSGKGESMLTDLPSSQFDHVILCVPNNQDTVWLECTDPSIPFGFLGSFTCDRDVLAITPEGGKILHTPAYGFRENSLSTICKMTLDKSGNAKAEITIRGTGLVYEDLFNLSEKKEDERKKSWTAWTGCPTSVIAESYSFEKKRLPSAEVRLTLMLYNLVPVSSNRLFINPAFLSNTLDEDGERSVRAFQQTDSVWITLPDKSENENIPEFVEYNTGVGSYSCETKMEGNQLFIVRNRQNLPTPADSQKRKEFNLFLSQVKKMENKMVVIKINWKTNREWEGL